MKLIIAGGRDLTVSDHFIQALTYHFNITKVDMVVSGACGRPPDELELGLQAARKWEFANGIDGCGEKWAKGLGIVVKRFPADFEALGLPAGPKRNADMAKFGDKLVLIWDGKSRGSASMKFQMEALKKPIYEVILRRANEPK